MVTGEKIKNMGNNPEKNNDIVYLKNEDLNEIPEDQKNSLKHDAPVEKQEEEILKLDKEDLKDDAPETPPSGVTSKKEEPTVKNGKKANSLNIDLSKYHHSDIKFNDFMLLYEIQKEITRANTTDELYGTILFALMGQIGATSSSIMVRNPKDVTKWIIVDSQGVTISSDKLSFDPKTGILEKVFSRGKIIDIDEFRDSPDLKEDYYKYISMDTKLLVPLKQDNEILGVVSIGGKMSSDEFNEADFEYLNFVGEVSAITLNNIITQERIMRANENLSKNLAYIRDIDRLHDRIAYESSITQVEEIISEEFRNMGIEGYTVYIKQEIDDTYAPVFFEKEDFLSIKNSHFSIADKNFLRLISKTDLLTMETPYEAEFIKEIFYVRNIKRMSTFRVYPFTIWNSLIGFILIYRVRDDANFPEIDSRTQRIARFIFYYITTLDHYDINKNRFVDNFQNIYRRIENDIQNAKNLNIPLTLVLFAIKNLKRYFRLSGRDKLGLLFDEVAVIIRNRLSDSDYSFRYDRNKILIVLPGKDKKFAAPLANSLKKEINNKLSSIDAKLLIHFLTATFPEDGEYLQALIDALD